MIDYSYGTFGSMQRGRMGEDAGYDQEGLNDRRRERYRNEAQQGQFPFARQGSQRAEESGAARAGAREQHQEGPSQAASFTQLQAQGVARPAPPPPPAAGGPGVMGLVVGQAFGADNPPVVGDAPTPAIQPPVQQRAYASGVPQTGEYNPETKDRTVTSTNYLTGDPADYTSADINQNRAMVVEMPDGKKAVIPTEAMGHEWSLDDFVDTGMSFDERTPYAKSWRQTMLSRNPKLYQQLMDEGGPEAVNAFYEGNREGIREAMSDSAKQGRKDRQAAWQARADEADAARAAQQQAGVNSPQYSWNPWYGQGPVSNFSMNQPFSGGGINTDFMNYLLRAFGGQRGGSFFGRNPYFGGR